MEAGGSDSEMGWLWRLDVGESRGKGSACFILLVVQCQWAPINHLSKNCSWRHISATRINQHCLTLNTAFVNEVIMISKLSSQQTWRSSSSFRRQQDGCINTKCVKIEEELEYDHFYLGKAQKQRKWTHMRTTHCDTQKAQVTQFTASD